MTITPRTDTLWWWVEPKEANADLAASRPVREYQLPLDFGRAVRVGPRRWKKQVLPLGEIRHGARVLDFSRGVLAAIVRNFKRRVFDYTPVNAATADNRHNEDPFRFIGAVKDLVLEDDGLYMVMEPNGRGEELLASNPLVGASVRFFSNFRTSGGEEVGPIVRHVCITQDPHVTGMKPGEFLMSGETPRDVLDLTRHSYIHQRREQEDMTSPRDGHPDPTGAGAAARAAAAYKRATPAQRNAMISSRRAQVGEDQLRREMDAMARASAAEYEAVLRRSGGQRFRPGHDTGGVY